MRRVLPTVCLQIRCDRIVTKIDNIGRLVFNYGSSAAVIGRWW
jgi:hypothetical protein